MSAPTLTLTAIFEDGVLRSERIEIRSTLAHRVTLRATFALGRPIESSG